MSACESVSVEGEDGKTFLQGFITADMERAGSNTFYSMMLNAQVSLN